MSDNTGHHTARDVDHADVRTFVEGKVRDTVERLGDFAPLLREADALLGNPISERLAEGWYPSVRDDESNLGWKHDRHVMIWVRNYEGLIRDLAAALESLSERDAAIRDLVGYIRTTDAYFNEYGWQSYALLIERRNLIDTMDALRDVKP